MPTDTAPLWLLQRQQQRATTCSSPRSTIHTTANTSNPQQQGNKPYLRPHHGSRPSRPPLGELINTKAYTPDASHLQPPAWAARTNIHPAPKFTGTHGRDGVDYTNWADDFRIWALPLGLWAHYDGSATRPPAESLDNARAKYDQESLAAYCCLIAAQPRHIRQLLDEFGPLRPRSTMDQGSSPPTSLPRPHLAWTTLESHFKRSEAAMERAAEKDLAQLQQQQDEGFLEYWQRAQNLLGKLRAAGGLMSDGIWRHKPLDGLPDEWEVFLVARQLTAEVPTPQLLSSLTEEAHRHMDCRRTWHIADNQRKPHSLNTEPHRKPLHTTPNKHTTRRVVPWSTGGFMATRWPHYSIKDQPAALRKTTPAPLQGAGAWTQKGARIRELEEGPSYGTAPEHKEEAGPKTRHPEVGPNHIDKTEETRDPEEGPSYWTAPEHKEEAEPKTRHPEVGPSHMDETEETRDPEEGPSYWTAPELKEEAGPKDESEEGRSYTAEDTHQASPLIRRRLQTVGGPRAVSRSPRHDEPSPAIKKHQDASKGLLGVATREETPQKTEGPQPSAQNPKSIPPLLPPPPGPSCQIGIVRRLRRPRGTRGERHKGMRAPNIPKPEIGEQELPSTSSEQATSPPADTHETSPLPDVKALKLKIEQPVTPTHTAASPKTEHPLQLLHVVMRKPMSSPKKGVNLTQIFTRQQVADSLTKALQGVPAPSTCHRNEHPIVC